MFKAGKFTQTLKGVARDFDTAIDSPAMKKAEKNKNRTYSKTDTRTKRCD